MRFSFAVVVDGVDLTGVHSPHPDSLYAAGCDDATLISDSGVQRAVFDRDADSFAAADANGDGYLNKAEFLARTKS